MFDKPVINFHIKPFSPILNVLHQYEYHYELDTSVSEEKFNNVVKEIEEKDFSSEFKKARKDWLFERDESSKKILDRLL